MTIVHLHTVKLICITIAEPQTHIKDCVCFILKLEVKGVAVGRKASDEVGLLNTLINSILEVKSVTLAFNAKTQPDLVRLKVG